MKASVSFEEIREFVEKRYGKKIALETVDAATVKVTYYQKVLIASLPISLNIRIEQVAADSLTLVYSGGTAVEMIVAGVLKLLKERLASLCDAITVESDRHILISLSKIEKARKILQSLALTSVAFTQSGVEVSAELK